MITRDPFLPTLAALPPPLPPLANELRQFRSGRLARRRGGQEGRKEDASVFLIPIAPSPLPRSVRPSVRPSAARSTLERADIFLPPSLPLSPRALTYHVTQETEGRKRKKLWNEPTDRRTRTRARTADGSATLSPPPPPPPVYYLWLGWLESVGGYSRSLARSYCRTRTDCRDLRGGRGGSLGILPVADLSICRSNDPAGPTLPPPLSIPPTFTASHFARCYVTPQRRRRYL